MKTIRDSRTTQTHVLRYEHLNPARRLFGGVLMQWIDEVAGIVARRHMPYEPVTAAVDNLVFKKPAQLGDLVYMEGRVTFIGTTSMEVRVDTYAEHPERERVLVNRAFLVMVALDEDGKPRAIPPVQLETDEERAEWERGQKRYALRKKRSKERF